MAIRLRKVGGQWIAVCAVESDSQEGDVYLDDGQHHALTTKFSLDYELGIADPTLVRLTEQHKIRDAEEEAEKWAANKKP